MRKPSRVFPQRSNFSSSLLIVLCWLVLSPCCPGVYASESPTHGICLPEDGRNPYFPVSKSDSDVCPWFSERISNCVDAKESSKERSELDRSILEEKKGKDSPKNDRVRDRPPKFDEFKHKALSHREKSGQAGNIMLRLERTGVEYNYASASKGAKVLASNKEAKGTSNILGKDMDKYLMNPCSAEEKFVVIELSEETLVCTVEIANFEHHSSNLNEFEVLGSMIYPTENWVKLGRFTAKNVKHSQRFRFEEPKWVRYLKLEFLSHYGSEFYCTLNTVKVYGTDAVEHLLEDLVSDPDSGNGVHEDGAVEGHSELISEDSNTRHVFHQSSGDDPSRALQSQGRVFGDSVLKILMQKVRLVDLNLLILERYVEELNSRYGNTFKEIDEEMAEKSASLEKIRLELRSLVDNQERSVKDVSDLFSWKTFVSLQIDALKREKAVLRSEMARVVDSQAHFENKGIIVLLLTFIFGLLSAVKLAASFSVNMFTGKQKHEEFCNSKIPWIMLLLNCATVGLILMM